MRTHLQFVSPAFDPEPREDAATNPGIFGKRLAGFLANEFGRLELGGGEPVAEDWGWMVPLKNREFPLWLGCASYDSPPEWLVFIEPSQPWVRKLFRRIDTTAIVADIAGWLETILTRSGSATDLRWWNDLDSGRK